jgi:hypothetical protein
MLNAHIVDLLIGISLMFCLVSGMIIYIWSDENKHVIHRDD